MSEPRPILVVDFGAQYAQLIARRVRECHVYSEIVAHDAPLDELKARRPGVPVLGICSGHQLMAQALGGEVEATGQREYGGTKLAVERPGVLLQDLGAE